MKTIRTLVLVSLAWGVTTLAASGDSVRRGISLAGPTKPTRALPR